MPESVFSCRSYIDPADGACKANNMHYLRGWRSVKMLVDRRAKPFRRPAAEEAVDAILQMTNQLQAGLRDMQEYTLLAPLCEAS